MKICWDNIEKLRITSKGNFIDVKNKKKIYVEKESCSFCGEAYLTIKSNQSNYCSHPCSREGKKLPLEVKKKISNKLKGRFVGEENPWYGKKHSDETKRLFTKQRTGLNNHMWKGGVIEKGLVLYSTYYTQLWADEVQKYTNEDGIVLIKVRCFKCNEWFVPSRGQVKSRIMFLNNKRTNEGRFYCSSECRDACNISYKSLFQIENSINNTDKYIPNRYELDIWSKEVLRRANYVCEYCGEKAEHAHHIQPKKLEPFYALDPDNGLACCEECHNIYCHKDECSTGNLANMKCD